MGSRYHHRGKALLACVLSDPRDVYDGHCTVQCDAYSTENKKS